MSIHAADTSRTLPSMFRRRLVGLLALSAFARVWLALEGGQYWWPDENRFEMARVAAQKLAIGHVLGACRVLFGSADHLAFKILALPAAALVNVGLPVAWAAVYLGLFSVGSIYMVWRIALLTADDEEVAWWSAVFAATSASLFYYSRQLFPYDAVHFPRLSGHALGVF